MITDTRHDHIRRVDVNGRIHFAGARYYAGSGLARDSVTGQPHAAFTCYVSAEPEAWI